MNFFLEGKADNSIGNVWFNRQASKSYHELMDADKELIVQMHFDAHMTAAETKKIVRKIALSIESKVFYEIHLYYILCNILLHFSLCSLNPMGTEIWQLRLAEDPQQAK